MLRVVAALVMLMVTGYWLVTCGVMLLPSSAWMLHHWSVDVCPALSVGCNDFFPLLAIQTVRSAVNSRQRAEETTEHALWLGHGRSDCQSSDEASSAWFVSHFQVKIQHISACSGALTGMSFVLLRRKLSRHTVAIQGSPTGGTSAWKLNPIPCFCVSLAVPVGHRGPGGDGAVEEGAHWGTEGDQEATGEREIHHFQFQAHH